MERFRDDRQEEIRNYNDITNLTKGDSELLGEQHPAMHLRAINYAEAQSISRAHALSPTRLRRSSPEKRVTRSGRVIRQREGGHERVPPRIMDGQQSNVCMLEWMSHRLHLSSTKVAVRSVKCERGRGRRVHVMAACTDAHAEYRGHSGWLQGSSQRLLVFRS